MALAGQYRADTGCAGGWVGRVTCAGFFGGCGLPSRPWWSVKVSVTPGTHVATVAGDVLLATITGLKDGTPYKASVAAVNSAGTGKGAAAAPSTVTPQVTVPAAPGGVRAIPVSSGVSVSWQPPASPGGLAIAGYVIAVAGTTRKLSAGASARSVTVTGLTKGRGYQFTVAARNAKGIGPAARPATATASGTVGSKTVVLSSASLAKLTTVETNGTLQFTSPPSQVAKLTAGAILVAGVSKATPAGLLAQVTKVTTSGSTVTVVTRAASLNQALTTAGFSAATALTGSQVAKFTPATSGITMAPRASGASIPVINYTLNKTLYQTSNGLTITASGTISVTANTSFDWKITTSGVTSNFTGSVTAAASVKLSGQVSRQFSPQPYPLGKTTFSPLSFSVLGVPIVVTPTLNLTLTVSGSASAGVTVSAGDSYTVGVTVATNNASVTATPTNSNTPAYPTPTTTGTMSASLGVTGVLSADVDSIVQTSLTDTLTAAKFTADTTKNPWWTLSGENVLALKIDLNLLGHTLTAYSKTLSDKPWTYARASGPFPGVSISPAQPTVSPGGTIQLTGTLNGNPGGTVAWQAAAGTIDTSGLYTAPATPGIYQVTATVPASGLVPAATGTASVQVGAQPPGSPSGVTAASTANGQATVAWTAPADDGGRPVTGYTITASPGGATYLVAGTATSQTIKGLAPGVTYAFTVTAANAAGPSLPSAPSAPVEIDNTVTVSGWTAAEAPLPSNAYLAQFPGPAVVITSVACPSAVTCVAVGSYNAVTAFGVVQEGLILTEASGAWTARPAPLPANASTGYQQAQLTALACATDGTCAAVGTYLPQPTSSSSPEGLLVSDVGGDWKAVTVPLPANASTAAEGFTLTAAACVSASACVAAGSYWDASSNSWPLLLTYANGSWSAAQGPLPNDSLDKGVTIHAASCQSASQCAVVGQLGQEGIILAGSGTSWAATEVPVINTGISKSVSNLESVACTSAGCTAAGWYDYNQGQQALLMTGSGSSWTPTEVTLPAQSVVGQWPQFAITCPTDSSCVVAGQYDSFSSQSNSLPVAVFLTGSGTSWTLTTPTPSGNVAGFQAPLNSVSCASDTSCVAVGTYAQINNVGPDYGQVQSGHGTSWTATEAPTPANSLTQPQPRAALSSVACASAACVAVGDYEDSSGFHEGLLLTETS